MWKKAYIRWMFLFMIATVGLVVFSAARTAKIAANQECTDSKDQCCQNKNQGEFVIWESLSRAVLSNIPY